MAYKADVGDYRESPALDVARLLEQRGATVTYSDPHVPVVDEHGVLDDAVRRRRRSRRASTAP